MILGLDISTSITGFAIVAEGEIVFYDSVDLRKYKNLFEKAERIKEAIFTIFDNYQFCREDDHWMEADQDTENKINHVYIEQSLHMFMGGKSSAKTRRLTCTRLDVQHTALKQLSACTNTRAAVTQASPQALGQTIQSSSFAIVSYKLRNCVPTLPPPRSLNKLALQ